MPPCPPIKASLFVTCIVDQLYPQVGVSVVGVLRSQGVDVDFPRDQTCCGQPWYNAGFHREARRLARRMLHTFQDSPYVVVPSGSCAAMLRVGYPDLFKGSPAQYQQAVALGARVYEFSQFLVIIVGVLDVGASYPHTVTYHPSCHLARELGVREEPRQLLKAVAELKLAELPQEDTCCGFGGSFAVRYPHISEGMVADKVASVVSTGADTLVSCDMGCLMQIGGALSRRGLPIEVRHLAQVLDQHTPSPLMGEEPALSLPKGQDGGDSPPPQSSPTRGEEHKKD